MLRQRTIVVGKRGPAGTLAVVARQYAFECDRCHARAPGECAAGWSNGVEAAVRHALADGWLIVGQPAARLVVSCMACMEGGHVPGEIPAAACPCSAVHAEGGAGCS